MNYIYILKSEKSNSYYVGSTKDLRSRLLKHNSGNVVSTRNRRPLKLMFCQEFKNMKIAQQVERKIKKWKRKDFIERIISEGKIEFIKN